MYIFENKIKLYPIVIGFYNKYLKTGYKMTQSFNNCGKTQNK